MLQVTEGIIARITVHYTLDPESRTWCFRVPSLGVVGGAATREDAEREAADAIAFALEYDDGAEGEAGYFQVSLHTSEPRGALANYASES